MARIPYQRVPSLPPYISQSAADRALVNVADDANAILIVAGGGPRRGASRTLKVFIENTPATSFRGGKNRYPVVFDLFPSAHLSLAENLVNIRNEVVRTFNREFGVTAIGTHLFEFDALYMIWKKAAGVPSAQAVDLVPTARGKLGAGMAKIIITFASVGAFELIGPIHEVVETARGMGWSATASLETAREKTTEHVVTERIADVQGFIHRMIAPKVSRRLKAAKAQDVIDADDLAMVMHDVLVDALARAQRAIASKGLLLIAADSIDAVDDGDKNSEHIRYSLASLLLSCGRHSIAGILCGREAGNAWLRELQDQNYKQEPLDLLPKRRIEAMLEAAKLDRPVIDEVLQKLGDTDDVVAGDFDQVCRRVVRIWPS